MFELNFEQGAEMDIFYFDLIAGAGQLSDDYALLSSAERQRADAFKFPHHRQRYIVAHACLRKTLADYVNLEPEKIVFTENPYKKPLLKGVEFNLSHSDTKMLLAINKSGPVGVDLEYIKPDIVNEGLAEISFSGHEYQSFLKLPKNKRVDAFFHLWTCKEAVIKAIGQGVYFGLENFSIDILDAKVLSIKNDDASQWRLQHIEAPAGFQAAVAWRGELADFCFNRS